MHRDYTYIHISLYEHLAKASDGESNVTKRRVNIYIYCYQGARITAPNEC